MQKACLGPYLITCSQLPEQAGNIFIDTTKSRRVAVISPLNSHEATPSIDAILLHSDRSETHCIRWYECPTTIGRTYTVIVTGCEVLITDFENGLTSAGGCNASSFGSNSFCFDFAKPDICSVAFEFEGLSFYVSGFVSDAFGLYKCEQCHDTSFEPLAYTLPQPPPEYESQTQETSESNIINQVEEKNEWTPPLDNQTGIDTLCNDEQIVAIPGECESRNNPSIAILPSGHALIAYEARNSDGTSQINIASIATSVEYEIFYYRALSRGTLINDLSIESGYCKFDIYDDVVIPVNESNQPEEPFYLGFLNGPLKGVSLFAISYAERTLQTNGRPKWTLSFDVGARVPEFSDSNNAFDVSYFISSNTSIGSTQPGGASVSLLSLPQHLDENGVIVPVSNPSIAVAKNAIMIDESINVFVAYQAFVNNKWNIYSRQILLSKNESESPVYLPPYSFDPPSTSAIELINSEFTTVVYRCSSLKTDANGKCALFYVYLNDGRQIYNLAESTGTYIHPCGSVADKSYVSIEARWYDIAECEEPDWVQGIEYTGEYPPTNATFYTGPSYCFGQLSTYPSSGGSARISANSCCHMAGQSLSNSTLVESFDVVNKVLPVQVGLSGPTVTLHVTGGYCQHCQTCNYSGPDGDTDVTSALIGVYPDYEQYGIAAAHVPYMALVGVFLTDDTPVWGDAPPARLGEGAPLGPSNVEYSPALRQIFFVGNGTKTFNVPSVATRLYLGTGDIYNWSDNAGHFDAQIVTNDISKWGFYESSCTQYYVYDDPYCPSPYYDLSIDYTPIDLWTINVGNETATRVLYNMSVNPLPSAVVSKSGNKQIDFVFVVDNTYDMSSVISNISIGISSFAQRLLSEGFDAKFGLVFFGRSNTEEVLIPDQYSDPLPVSPGGMNGWIFDALQNLSSDGFTSSPEILSQAFSYWGLSLGSSAPWLSIQYSLVSQEYLWRDESKKYVMLFTNSDASEFSSDAAISVINNTGDTVLLTNSKENTIDALVNNNIDFICSICVPPPVGTCTIGATGTDGSVFAGIATTTGWNGEDYYNIAASNCFEVFDSILVSIKNGHAGLTVLERDTDGYSSTFLKPAEMLVTYDGDLLDIWTNNKILLEFTDQVMSFSEPNNGLSNLPFDLFGSSIYDIESIHVLGTPTRWIYYADPGLLEYDYPSVGCVSSGRTAPLLLATNAIRPSIQVNNRNTVVVAYENHSSSSSKISLISTGDLHYNGITGDIKNRITKLISENSFVFSHTIQLNGLNNLCDLVIDKNDVIHITWQSNVSGYWEIYYANSSNVFDPVRITSADSRSGMPKIDIEDNGSIYIVYHDNRFGPYQPMLSYKDERRVLPLMQQDPYLASIASGYRHYTNILPLYLINESTTVQGAGRFLATNQLSDDYGSELFSISSLEDPYSSSFLGYFNHDGTNYTIAAMASSYDGYLYAITVDGILLEASTPSVSLGLNVDLENLREIGTIPISGQPLPLNNSLVYETSFDGFNVGTDWSTGLWKQSADRDAIGFDWCESHHGIQHDCDKNLYETSSSSGYCGSYYSTTNYRRASVQCSHSGSTRNQEIEFEVIRGENGTSPVYKTMLRMSSDAWPYSYPFYAVSLWQPVSGFAKVSVEIVTDEYTSTLVGESQFEYTWELDPTATMVKIQNYNRDSSVYFDTYLNGELVSRIIDAEQTNETLLGELVNFPSGYYVGLAIDGIYWEGCSGAYYGYSYWGISQGRISYFSLTDLNSIPVTSDTDYILDATCDPSGRLWVSVVNENINGEKSIKLLNINKETAEIINSAEVYSASTNIDRVQSALTCLLDGSFLLITNRQNQTIVSKSSYPIISEDSAVFSFQDVAQNQIIVDALASTETDTVYAIDNESNVYTVDPSTGIFSVVSDQDPYDPYIGFVEQIGAFVYQFSGRTSQTGEEGYFHVIVQFYDNINLEGSPVIEIDSRTNMEAFLNAIEGSESFSGMNGLFLSPNGFATIYFNSSHYRPNDSDLSYPYCFDTNQTYFPKVYLISPSNNVTLVDFNQNTSFSCNRCSTNNSNLADAEGCAYSFELSTEGYHDLVVDFYGDVDRYNWLDSYVAKYGSNDLQYFEVNNNSANDLWTDVGLSVSSDEYPMVQVYPLLSNQTIIENGINYHVSVSEIESFQFNSGDYNGVNFTSSELNDSIPNGSWSADDITIEATTTLQKITWHGAALINSEIQWSDYAARFVILKTVNELEEIYTSDIVNFSVIEELGTWGLNTIYKAELELKYTLPAGTYLIGVRLEGGGRNYVAHTNEHYGSYGYFISEDAGVMSWEETLNSYSIAVEGISRVNNPISTGTFICNGASSIFDKMQVNNIAEIGRWKSSNFGCSDIRLTDTTIDNVRPRIKTRSTGSAIILFEEISDEIKIKGTTFRKSIPNEFFGSGTQSWFDYDFQITGKNHDIDTDIYDRISVTYEKPDSTNSIVNHNSIAFKLCSFYVIEIQSESTTKCDIHNLAETAVEDRFLSDSVIKKIQVKPSLVDYYTYNAVNRITPVVSQCNIIIEIVSAPEIVALRCRNENEAQFSEWCNNVSEIGDYTTELSWKLSPNSGIKSICVQALTYSGITTEFCMPIILDLVSQPFTVKLYSDNQYANLLPEYNGIHVASTLVDANGSPLTSKTIYVEISFKNEIQFNGSSKTISFDVLQQGINDIYNLSAQEVITNGQQVFRGYFDIYLEDNSYNRDGLAYIRVKYPDDCQEVALIKDGPFAKDSLNSFDKPSTVEADTSLDIYRNDVSGRIGVGTAIRPNEDPYFIFGDPGFSK